MAKKLAPANEWQNRELKDWNAITFRSYIAAKHEKKYKLPYVTNSIAAENKNIKRMYEEHGKEVLKEFIDLCFENHRPSPKHRGITFFFMYTWMRESVLHLAITKVENRQKQVEREAHAMSADEAKGWF